MATGSIVPLLVFARISGLLVAVLVLIWAFSFRSSFLPHSSSQEDQGIVYAVLHPLFMVIGFILISGEAILIHRWLPGSRSLKKSVHLCLQGVALASGIFGIWTKFQGNNGIVANFYSLHSWMGLICVLLFGAHWLMGFLSFWHRGEVLTVRLRVLPWHIVLGLYTNGLAVATAETGLLEKLIFLQTKRNVSKHCPESMATAETGLLEKLIFLQTKRNVSKHCPESMVVNSLGLALTLLSVIVILAAVSPKYQAFQSKLIYSSDTKKCVSS